MYYALRYYFFVVICGAHIYGFRTSIKLSNTQIHDEIKYTREHISRADLASAICPARVDCCIQSSFLDTVLAPRERCHTAHAARCAVPEREPMCYETQSQNLTQRKRWQIAHHTHFFHSSSLSLVEYTSLVTHAALEVAVDRRVVATHQLRLHMRHRPAVRSSAMAHMGHAPHPSTPTCSLRPRPTRLASVTPRLLVLLPTMQWPRSHRVADQAPKRVHADGVPRVP